MKKLFFIILLSPCILFSQEEKQNVSKKKFGVGITFSPELVSNKIYSVDPLLRGLVKAENKQEVFKIGFTAGANFMYKMNESFSIKSGLFFSNKGFKISDVQITTIDYPEGGLGTRSFYFNYNYFEIPISIDWNFVNKERFLFHFSFGVIYNRFVSGNYSIYRFRKIKKNDDNYLVFSGEIIETQMNKNLFALVGAIGVGFKISEKMEFGVQLEHKRMLTSLYNVNTFRRYLRSFGLSNTLIYKF